MADKNPVPVRVGADSESSLLKAVSDCRNMASEISAYIEHARDKERAGNKDRAWVLRQYRATSGTDARTSTAAVTDESVKKIQAGF